VVAGLAKPGDVVLTMGAGDVTALGPLIVAALRERAGEPGAADPGAAAAGPAGQA
jgi:UDP-N-acetylmuramate--alanine ligase